MGNRTEWKCNNCEFILTTSGPWELYPNGTGERGVYWHPRPRSKKAAQAGIKCYFVKWYCPNCRKVENSVEIGFKEHVDRYEHRNQSEMALEPQVFCAICGTGLKEQLDSEVCPECNKGSFRLSNRWWH